MGKQYKNTSDYSILLRMSICTVTLKRMPKGVQEEDFHAKIKENNNGLTKSKPK